MFTRQSPVAAESSELETEDLRPVLATAPTSWVLWKNPRALLVFDFPSVICIFTLDSFCEGRQL